MPDSISRRSRLSASSCCAIFSARPSSSVIRHSIPSDMSARRPAALTRGPIMKPRSLPEACAGLRPAARKMARRPGVSWPWRMRLRPWLTSTRLLWSSLTTSATVPRATRSSRQRAGARCALLRKPVALAQFGAQRQHHVEDHADAGQMLARETAAGKVGVDDAVGGRQFVARQVVVGDQRGDAELPGAGDAVDAGDAVVNGDDELRLFRRRQLDDVGGESVAVGEAVRDQIIDLCAESP
jgi:hypothetical protein